MGAISSGLSRQGAAGFLVAVLLASSAPASPDRGPETNLPLPRFVSLKASEANIRRGPNRSHRIDWVFQRRAMPLQVTAEHGHWRRVRDRDGAGGWVHYALISGVRTVLVDTDWAELRARPDPAAPLIAKAQRNVIARLGKCGPVWCRVRVDGHRGWVEKAALWGVRPDEIRD